MKILKPYLAALCAASSLVSGAPPDREPQSAEQSVAARLCAAYESIDTISCSVRKTSAGGGQTVRMLSRVFYRSPDRLHVDIVSPTRRRVICDGETLYYHDASLPRGFARPVDDLEGPMLASLRNIPGTPMEHLRKLREAQEHDLPPEAGHPDVTRKAYLAGDLYAVLTVDADLKPLAIEFFKSADRSTKTAEARYSRFTRVSDTCWIPCLHKTTVYRPDGTRLEETRRVDTLKVNGPLPDHLFNPELFFDDVDFVDDFQQTYAP